MAAALKRLARLLFTGRVGAGLGGLDRRGGDLGYSSSLGRREFLGGDHGFRIGLRNRLSCGDGFRRQRHDPDRRAIPIHRQLALLGYG